MQTRKPQDIVNTYINTAFRQGKGNLFSFWDVYDYYAWYRTVLDCPDAIANLWDDQGNPKPSFYALMQALFVQATAEQISKKSNFLKKLDFYTPSPHVPGRNLIDRRSMLRLYNKRPQIVATP